MTIIKTQKEFAEAQREKLGVVRDIASLEIKKCDIVIKKLRYEASYLDKQMAEFAKAERK